jgi:glucose-1-phosphate thymidylyltransferase
MRAFILAGGFATRLWPLTEKRAKPLLPLAGKPLLTHLVEKIPEGIGITVSTNSVFSDDFEAWKEDTRPAYRPGRHKTQDTRIEILIEDTGHEDEKLGALGAVAKWITEEKIDDDVLLIAGDNYVGFSIEAFIDKYMGRPLLAAYDIKDKEKAKLFGTVITEGSHVKAFEEKPDNPKSTLVSTGCYILPRDSLSEVVTYAKEHPDNIGGIFEHFLKKGITVDCASFTDPWFDIGSFEAYLEATYALVGNDVHIGKTCSAPPEQNTFEGSNVIGNNSNVKGSTLRNVVLFENCEIEDSVLENCIIDNNCTLKGVDLTDKMLREGTKLLR